MPRRGLALCSIWLRVLTFGWTCVGEDLKGTWAVSNRKDMWSNAGTYTSDPAFSAKLSGFNRLMYRSETSKHFRAAIMSLEILDITPDWNRFRAVFEHVSRQVVRLRQKVLVPTLPTTAPRWIVDGDFNLDFHVRRMRVPDPGTLRQVIDLAEVVLQSPLDISRPLWTATLVEGLADGRAAMLFHTSHAMTDGVGLVQLLRPIYDLEREPLPESPGPQPIPQGLSQNGLMWEGLKHMPSAIAGGLHRGLPVGVSAAVRVILNPTYAATGFIRYVQSAVRLMSRAAKPSPLLHGRSLAIRTEALDIPLSDLRKAAKAGGGSINDAYLAGLCGALGRYHAALGVSISALPMEVAVSLRTDADPLGGNRFVDVNMAAPIGVADPLARMQAIRTKMVQCRQEPALGMIGSIAPALNVLPAPVLDAIIRSSVVSDVVASNVPFYKEETYVAGAKILRQYGFGPLNVAMVVELLSRGGYCTITVRYDRAAISDETMFAQCLVDGFNEILSLAGEPAPSAVPVSSAAYQM